MPMFSPDVNIDSPLPLPIEGGNTNPVIISGSVSLTGSTDGVALDSSLQTLITNVAADQVALLAAEAAQQAALLTDVTAVGTKLTNGTQHTLIDNFPAFPASQVVTLASTTITGTVYTTPTPSLASTVVQMTSNGANQMLLAANPLRQKAILFFSSGIWSVKLGVGASSTSFTYQIASSNTTLEISPWCGEIDAICTTSGKLVNVTECH